MILFIVFLLYSYVFFNCEKLFEFGHILLAKVVNHVFFNLLNLIFRKFAKYHHNVAMLFLRVEEMFRFFHGMSE